MAQRQYDIALRHLNALFSLGAVGDLTDGELLTLFTVAETRPRSWHSRFWLIAMGQWCSRCATPCFAIQTTCKMRFKPRSWSWSRRRGVCGCAIVSVRGCIR